MVADIRNSKIRMGSSSDVVRNRLYVKCVFNMVWQGSVKLTYAMSMLKEKLTNCY